MSEGHEPRNAYGLLVFFTLLNAVNFVDRNLLFGLSTDVIRDLDLTYAQFSLLTGLVFTMFYVTVGIALGAIADRTNRPRLIAIGLFVWSLMTAATGVSRNFFHVATARLFLGAGEATLTPTSLSLMSDVIEPKKRAFVSGVYYAGVPLGTGFGLIYSGIVGPWIGWRWCFASMGALGLVLVAFVLMVKDPPRGAMESHLGISDGARLERPGSVTAAVFEFLRVMKKSPGLVYTFLSAIFLHFAMGSTFLDQPWLVTVRGYSTREAPVIFGSLFLVGGLIGTIGGGLGSDMFHRRWAGGRMLYLGIWGLLFTPLLLTYRFIQPRTWLFYSIAFLGCMSLTGAYGAIFSTVQALSPVRVRSTAIACLLFASNFIGVSAGSYAAGKLTDIFTQGAWFPFKEPMTWGIFLPSLIGIGAIPMNFLAARTYAVSLQRVHEQEPAFVDYGPSRQR